MNVQVWKYYGRYYKRDFWKLFLTVFIAAGQALIHLSILLLIRRTFDNPPSSNLGSFYIYLGIAVLSLYMANEGIILWVRHAVLKITKTSLQKLREELLQKIYSLPYSYLHNEGLNKLYSVIVYDTERLDIMSNMLVAQLMPALLLAVSLGAVMFYLNWPLFLLMVGLFPILLFAKVIGKMVKEKVYSFHRSFERFSKAVISVLQKRDLTFIQNAEALELEKVKTIIRDVHISGSTMAWLKTAHTAFHNTVVNYAAVLVLVAGGISVARGMMSLGAFLSFYAAVIMSRTYLQTITFCIPEIIEGSESLNTLYNLLNTYEVREYTGTKRTPFHGHITFKSVSFSFRTHQVLRNVNFIIPENSAVLILGPNGSGKSTIVNLLLGFYRPQEGHIYADGCPLDDIDIINFRRYIKVVRQEPVMFSGSVWENITYGYHNVDSKEVFQAAELAMAHEFIQELPHGYNTFVGENGSLLSGGQCQRIAIARALLGNPAFLVFDEASNHLDTDTFRRIMKNIKMSYSNQTRLILSSNSNIVEDVQYIYIIRDGILQPYERQI